MHAPSLTTALLAVVAAYSRSGSLTGGLPMLLQTALYAAALLLATAPLRRWLAGRLGRGRPPQELLQTLLLLGAQLRCSTWGSPWG